MPKFVLTGADGHLGSIAATFACEIRKPDQELVLTTYKPDSVAAATKEAWEKAGAKVETASYDDVESLKRAFAGAEAVAMISTWLFGAGRRRQAATVIEAAKQCGVRRVCYTSFVGAHVGETAATEEEIPFLPRDHAHIEGLLRSSGLEYSIARDYLYADNVAWLFAPSWRFCGDRWLNNSHGGRGAYVSREDCGRAFAALLLGRGEPNKVYELTGPEAVTDREVFDWMCAQTGYRAEFVDVPDDELYKWWLDRGLPLDFTGDFSKVPMKLCMGDLLCCGEMMAKGYMAEVNDNVERLTGRKAQGFREVLMKYKDSFPRPE